MADVKWTPEQQQCIDARGGTVLVSAAAGSGKTAVLVQRVLGLITNTDHPIDIDRLLIVTFTNAAAAEMRQRLSNALSERLALDPHNAHLQRQQRLLPNAHISTVHAFCGKLLREYYYLLDISPQYKLIDQASEELLKAEAMAELLEQRYTENDPAFIRLADAVNTQKSDDVLTQTIRRIHTFIQSYPFPDRWLDTHEQSYDDTVPFEQTLFGSLLLKHIREQMAFVATQLDAAYQLVIGVPNIETAYGETIAQESQLIATLQTQLIDASWDEAVRLIQTDVFGRLSPLKNFEDLALKEQVKSLRSEAKDAFSALQTQLGPVAEHAADDLRYHAELVHELFDLVRTFSKRFNEKKTAKRWLNFNDLEHLSLRLLVTEDDNGQLSKTPIAREIANRFDEILVDEYQDTNATQETLFSAISHEETNLFMVGDVKQSIYGFRQAMPELFLNRRKRYPTYDGNVFPSTITLGHNFRSRPEVTETVNFLFRQWMTAELCGMDYDQHEALVPRASYLPQDDRETELMILRRGDDDSDVAEAQAIADRIHQLKTSFSVDDKGTLRPLQYRDVVILLRSRKTHAQVYVDVLRKNGIPAYTDEPAGFFAAPEIACMLSLLRVIDNPVQDIPLLSVLFSPLFGFSPDDLAAIRTVDRRSPLFVAVRKAIRSTEIDDDLKTRCRACLAQLDAFRKASVSMPADKLIRLVFEETRYLDLVRAQKRGAAKEANLQQLYGHAKQFEQNGFRGLSAFIRFCDRLEQQGLDMGASNTLEQDDAVHVMTVHHSKGLEFPVVFLARMGASFNTKAEAENLLLHNRVGLGMTRRDVEKRRQYDTLPHICVKQAIRKSDRAEELRVLYVAMTRAREKLILVMSAQKPEKLLSDAQFAVRGDAPVSAAYLNSASSMAHWLIAGIVRHPSVQNAFPLETEKATTLPCETPISIRIIEPDSAEDRPDIVCDQPIAKTVAEDRQLTETMRVHMAYRYPYEAAMSVPTKVAASHLPGEEMFAGTMLCKRPAFAHRDALTPTERGTAVHTFMQFADFENAKHDLNQEIDRLVTAGRLTPVQAGAVDANKVRTFLDGDLYRRMRAANQVWREWRFSIEWPASRLMPQAVDVTDTVTVQGMIDCAFCEKDTLVLVDYKTDRVKNGEELVDRYREQLAIYADALQQILHLPVKEIYLYSFALGKPIPVILAK